MAKIEYSCKRRKDFVTFFAIVMFLLICVFEAYLIIVLPVQMQRQDAMLYQTKKQNLLRSVEWVRAKVAHTKAKNRLQESEIQLVRSVADSVTLFIRTNNESLTMSQIDEIFLITTKLTNIINQWDRNQFYFKEHSFDISPILRNIDRKLSSPRPVKK